MRSAKPKNNIAADVFADYQRRYDEGLPIRNPAILLDQLTDLQRKFVTGYLQHLNGSKAVVEAGYDTKYPNRIATQLLHNPRIRLVIDILQADRAKKTSVGKDYALKRLQKIIDNYENAETAAEAQVALRGLELLMRHLGMFVDKTEITGKDGAAIQYEKVEEDARDFTSAIARLTERGGEGSVPLKLVPGGKG